MTTPSNTTWTTSRLALIAVLSAVSGVFTTVYAYAFTALNNAFGVIGAALLQPQQIFMFLGCWLVPIRGVFLLSGTISGFANFLSGDPTGVTTIYWGIASGVAGEIALALFRSRPGKRSWIIIVAGLLYIPATNVVTYFVFGWTVNTTFYAGIVIALIAITVQSSLPAIALGKWVLRTGLLRTAPIPVERRVTQASPTIPSED